MTIGRHPDHVAALQLVSTTQAPAEARALVDTLAIVLSCDQRYDLRLALSELVTNSVVHGSQGEQDPVEVLISMSDATIRCEVGDQGPGFRPEVVRDAAVGLGLVLVERIASRWGTDDGGRRVWFELDRTG